MKNERWYICASHQVLEREIGYWRHIKRIVKLGLNTQPNSQSINNFVNQSTDYSIDLLIKMSNIKMTNFSSNRK